MTLLEILEASSYLLLIILGVYFLLDKAISSISRRSRKLKAISEELEELDNATRYELDKIKKEMYLPSIINKQLRSLQVDNRLRAAEKKLSEYFDMIYVNTNGQDLRIKSLEEFLQNHVNKADQRWKEFFDKYVKDNEEIQQTIRSYVDEVHNIRQKLPA